MGFQGSFALRLRRRACLAELREDATGQKLGHRCPRRPSEERIMPPQVATTVKPGSWPISVGASGIAAAQFARCGFDVMIQAGHDKPWYDLVVTRSGNLLKIGIKA